jgi:hypothetical protein
MALNRILGGSKFRYGWLNLGIQVAQNQNIIHEKSFFLIMPLMHLPKK